MRRERKRKDPRVTVRHTRLKTGALLFVIFLVLGGGYMMIYQAVLGIDSSVENLLIPEQILYLLLMALILCLVVSIGRSRAYDRPIQELGQAAEKVAEGDFSLRVTRKRRPNGRKDYLDVLYEDFNKMVEELSTIEALKSDFVASVSHEIKTPLAVIQNYATVLQSEDLPPDQRRAYSETIVSASQRLTNLVTNILKLNKLENQGITPQSEEYDLSEQLRCCVLHFEDLWEKRNLNLNVDLEDDVHVRYDEGMVELVWNNLISNAIKFTPMGGTVTISLKTAEEDFAVVTVCDNGFGMDEQTQRHIFDQFYQGDSSHAQEGNGLGLALVRKVLELLGGSISVESGIGKGSSFTVWLEKI